MIYFYMNNGNLYSSDISLIGKDFIKITEEEYNAKLKALTDNREIGTPNNFKDVIF